jgi:hypothetical protein
MYSGTEDNLKAIYEESVCYNYTDDISDILAEQILPICSLLYSSTNARFILLLSLRHKMCWKPLHVISFIWFNVDQVNSFILKVKVLIHERKHDNDNIAS